MDATFEQRKQELIEECAVAPQVFDQVMPRLERFMETLVRREQIEHALTFVQGLLSDLENKNVESIAYRFGQDRMPLQWFVGMSDWDDRPLREELVRQVAQQLGRPDGILVFDPSAFPKSGKESVGVVRQWYGRLGKVDNRHRSRLSGFGRWPRCGGRADSPATRIPPIRSPGLPSRSRGGACVG